MKNPNSHIRKSFYEALNGAVFHESEVVPVYEGGGDQSAGKQVLLLEQTFNESNTKNSFGGDCTLVIEVVAKGGRSVSRRVVDEIAESVLEVLMPTTRTTPVTSDEFQFTALRLETLPGHIIEDDESFAKIIRLPMIIGFNATQTNY